MSILNCWVQPDKALIGVDTEALSVDGSIAGHVSKLQPLVGMNAIVAVTGTALFGSIAFGTTLAVYGGVDVLITKMPELLQMMYERSLKAVVDFGLELGRDPEKLSVLVCGWSTKLERPVCRYYVQTDAAVGFIEYEPLHGVVQPCLPADWSNIPDPDTPEAMGCYAKQQARYMRQCTKAHAGGPFVVVEITRDGMSIRPVCDLNND